MRYPRESGAIGPLVFVPQLLMSGLASVRRGEDLLIVRRPQKNHINLCSFFYLSCHFEVVGIGDMPFLLGDDFVFRTRTKGQRKSMFFSE